MIAKIKDFLSYGVNKDTQGKSSDNTCFPKDGNILGQSCDKYFQLETPITQNEIIREKIRNLEYEANLNNRPQNLLRVGMLHCLGVNDDKTTIGTYGLAPCIGLAIAATDSNDVTHRIVTHNPYMGENVTREYENGIEDYLQSLGAIKKLDAMICSMDSFRDFNNLDEREQEILIRLGNTFRFYKEEQEEFTIPFHESWYVKVSPEGKFEYADLEMIGVYREMEEDGTLYNHSSMDINEDEI
ncbi:MAG: hypothetical protein A2Y24_01490 [Clostridiales bacterium GWE2_32_10]|nr:MAG: hypothetical protein A2Y24_01490 [Clostridiales bacterium GWE2_32_10]HBY19790.1 hypothetical protein [Clostridiales bacterium]